MQPKLGSGWSQTVCIQEQWGHAIRGAAPHSQASPLFSSLGPPPAAVSHDTQRTSEIKCMKQWDLSAEERLLKRRHHKGRAPKLLRVSSTLEVQCLHKKSTRSPGLEDLYRGCSPSMCDHGLDLQKHPRGRRG